MFHVKHDGHKTNDNMTNHYFEEIFMFRMFNVNGVGSEIDSLKSRFSQFIEILGEFITKQIETGKFICPEDSSEEKEWYLFQKH